MLLPHKRLLLAILTIAYLQGNGVSCNHEYDHNPLLRATGDFIKNSEDVKHCNLIFVDDNKVVEPLLSDDILSNRPAIRINSAGYLHPDVWSRESCSLVIIWRASWQMTDAYFSLAWKNRRAKLDFHLILDATTLELLVDKWAQRFLYISGLFKPQRENHVTVLGQSLQFENGARTIVPINFWSEKLGFSRRVFFNKMDTFDFGGHHFRVVAMVNQFFVKRDDKGGYHGSEVKKFGFLGEKLNFKMNFTQSFDGKFGTLDPTTHQWNGAISMLMREEVDWCLGGYIVNYPRATVIDYARIPFCMIATGLNFLTSLPSPLPPWLAIAYPFEFFVWLSIAAAILTFAPLASVILSFGVKQRVGLAAVFNWMANLLSSRGRKAELTPHTASSLVIMTTWCIFSTILTFGYISCLVSSLTFVEKEKPLQTWQDVLDSDYYVSFAFGTNEQLIVETASQEFSPQFYELGQRVKRQNKSMTYLPFNPSKVQEHIERHPRTIFIMTLFDIFPSLFPFNFTGHQVLHVAAERDFSYYISLPFQRSFPYLDLFNKYFDRFFDMGIDTKLLSDATSNQKVASVGQIELKQTVTLVLAHFQGPFLMLGIGLGVSALALVTEVLRRYTRLAKVTDYMLQ